MPRDSNGVYTLPAGNPVISGTVIESSWANGTMSDMANELTGSLSRSGEGGMLAPFKKPNGSAVAPSDTWTNEPSAGWYRAGAADIRFAIAAADIFRLVPTGPEVFSGGGWEPISTGNYFPGNNPDLLGANAALLIGGADPSSDPHMEIGPTAIQAKSDGTTATTLNIQPEGNFANIWASGAIKARFTSPFLGLRSTSASGGVPNWIQFEDSGGGVDAFLGFVASSDFWIENEVTGGNVVIRIDNAPAGTFSSDLGGATVSGMQIDCVKLDSNLTVLDANAGYALRLGSSSTHMRLSNTEIQAANGGNGSTLRLNNTLGGSTLIGSDSTGPYLHLNNVSDFLEAGFNGEARLRADSAGLDVIADPAGVSRLSLYSDVSEVAALVHTPSSNIVTLSSLVAGDDLSFRANLSGTGFVDVLRYNNGTDEVQARNTTTGAGLERVLTTSDLSAVGSQVYTLSADETRTSTTLATPVPDLSAQFQVPAGGRVHVKGMFLMNQGGGANGGARIFNGHTDMNHQGRYVASDAANDIFGGTLSGLSSSAGTSLTPAGVNANDFTVMYDVVYHNPTGAALDFEVTFAQEVSNAVATTMKAGSFIEVTNL